MANASFYTFAKRKNSTLQPTGTHSTIDIQLKSGTSLISPTFLLSYSGRPAFNYVIYEGRNYFINDITSVRNDLWELACTEDFLGSWKTDIGSTTALILYASGGRSDIIDKRIGITDDIIIHNNSAAIPNITISPLGAGSIVLAVTGVGSFGNFILDDNSKLSEILDGVDTWWGSQSISNAWDALKQFIFGGSAAECVKNCLGMPFKLTDSSFSGNIGPVQTINLGRYPVYDAGGAPIYFHKIVNPIYSVTTTIAIPWEYSDWRRHSPYTSVFIYLPFIGCLSLSADEICEASSLDVKYAFNLCSGDIAVEVSIDSPIKIIATASASVGMNMTFGSSNISGDKIVSAAATGITAIAGAAATIASGGAAAPAVVAGIAGAGMGAAGVVQGLGGDTHGGGGLSGGASGALTDHIMVSTVSLELTDTQSNLDSVMGKPVMKKATIGSYSGYVQTDGMEVAGNMLDQEREAINNLCNGGIYYE